MAETPQSLDGNDAKDQRAPDAGGASAPAEEPRDLGEEAIEAGESEPQEVGETAQSEDPVPSVAAAADNASDDGSVVTPGSAEDPADSGEEKGEQMVAETVVAEAGDVQSAEAVEIPVANEVSDESKAESQSSTPSGEKESTEAGSALSTDESGSAEPEHRAETESPTEDFAQMLDGEGDLESAATSEAGVGDKISGVIVKVGDENSFVDYGSRGEAVIRTSELKDPKGEMLFKVGDPIEAFVISTGDEIQISRGLSRQDAQADLLYQAYKAGMPVEGRIDAVNKWGLGVTIEGDVRGFCPMSQVDTKFVENAEEFRGQKLAFKIIEFRHQGRDIVVSRRALIEAEQDQEANSVRAGIKKGAKLEGKITRFESFGAFVALGGGVEGLIHVSEISHQRVAQPQDVLEVGQTVQVEVVRLKDLGKRRKERISLSIKALEVDPWKEISTQFPAGTVGEGKVDGIEDFGAFVELAEGVRGLVHVSEIADRRIGHPREVLSLGDQVKVVVLEVDSRRQRLRLSIRQVDALESAANLKDFRERQQKEQEESQGNNVMLDALKRANLID